MFLVSVSVKCKSVTTDHLKENCSLKVFGNRHSTVTQKIQTGTTEKQEQRPCYQQTTNKQRVFGCDKFKIDLAQPRSSSLRGQPHSSAKFCA